MFYLSAYSNPEEPLWLFDPESPEDDGNEFLNNALASSKELLTFKTDQGDSAVLKKYEMARFSSQEETDRIIADFAKIVKEHCGVELLKKDTKTESEKN